MNTLAIKFPRQAKGKRPNFFDDPAIDQMLTFFLELTTEVSVLRDRLNTVEHLLEEKGTISRKDIEEYRPTETIEKDRTLQRQAYLKRVFRMHSQDSKLGE